MLVRLLSGLLFECSRLERQYKQPQKQDTAVDTPGLLR